MNLCIAPWPDPAGSARSTETAEAAASVPAMRPAFSAVGIAIEQAIVTRGSLDPLPIADQLLAAAAGPSAAEIRRGAFCWSHQFALHRIVIGMPVPAPSLAGLAAGLAVEVAAIDRLLAAQDARLLPGGMHPWMRAAVETQFWPHAHAETFRLLDRIVDCRRDNWATAQGMTITLPFSGDDEFARLHAGIRLVLPIIPALAAASPFAEGADHGCADHRLAGGRDGSGPTPLGLEIAGGLIPDSVSSRAAYDANILAPIRRSIAPYDPHCLLRPEWLDASGAIACFARSVIEIRIADTQECPLADVAVAGAIIAVVRMLYDEDTATLEQQQGFATAELADILQRCLTRAELAPLNDAACAAYLALLGYPKYTCSAQHLWRYLLRTRAPEPGLGEAGIGALDQILEHGSLATRLRRATHGDVTPARLHSLYRRLADCLAQGRLFGEQRVP